jgi:hypothetical protein
MRSLPVLRSAHHGTSMKPHLRALLALGLCLFSLAFANRAQADESRRFFDFTPATPNNPVVATIDGTIEIPLSELRGYRDAERLHAITDPASLAQKRAVLDDLLGEYLLVDEAHRSGVVQSPAFTKQMEATRTLILTDLISTRAVR